VIQAYFGTATIMTAECSDCLVQSLGLGGRGRPLVIASLFIPILAVFLVSNRLYWRFRLLGRFGHDDLATILATVRPDRNVSRDGSSNFSNRPSLLFNALRLSQPSTLDMADLLIRWGGTKLLKH